MTPERSQVVESLYHAALERADEERAAFLAAECRTDEALRLPSNHCWRKGRWTAFSATRRSRSPRPSSVMPVSPI